MRTVTLEAACGVEQTEVGAAAVPSAAGVLHPRLPRAVHDVNVERLRGALLQRLRVTAVPLVGPGSGAGERRGEKLM